MLEPSDFEIILERAKFRSGARRRRAGAEEVDGWSDDFALGALRSEDA